jgi:hypothetical protein
MVDVNTRNRHNDYKLSFINGYNNIISAKKKKKNIYIICILYLLSYIRFVHIFLSQGLYFYLDDNFPIEDNT